MTKIVQFTKDWDYSPNGFNVVSYKANDVIELDDVGADLAISEEVAKAVSDAALKKAIVAREQLISAALSAEKAADDAEAAAVTARSEAMEARRKADGARVSLATDDPDAV